MASLIYDTPAADIIRFVSGNRLMQFPEERPGFEVPDTWLEILKGGDPGDPDKEEKGGDKDEEDQAGRTDRDPYAATRTDSHHLAVVTRTRSREQTTPFSEERQEVEETHELEKSQSLAIKPQRTEDGTVLVDWYTTDDAANPQNWSRTRRSAITFVICLYTFAVYITSAIYTPSIEGVMEEFGVSQIRASLGLSLYVLGYGIGPLLWSPLSELPRIGRSPVYIFTMFIFVILSIPTGLGQNYAGLMVLRFLQGFFGSPCLANGAASLGDIFQMSVLPLVMMFWVSAAYCGPALGPLASGFSVPVKGWRWSLWESLWLAGPVFVIMFFFLPETSATSILSRRAKRLRQVTGNSRYMSQAEINTRNLKVSAIAFDALIKPMEITIKDPAVLFVQVYTAIVYAIYYSFFDVFPLVFGGIYGMNLGETGLVFLSCLVACIIGVATYSAYLYFKTMPEISKHGFPVNERWLIPGIPSSVFSTVGLFLFAWTARASIHWIVPAIGIVIYAASGFVIMQCVFIYIPLSYPAYAASLFGANDFFRSTLACASVLFAQPLFHNLGIGRGTSLLGGLSVIGVIGIVLLYLYGARLRAKSSFAVG